MIHSYQVLCHRRARILRRAACTDHLIILQYISRSLLERIPLTNVNIFFFFVRYIIYLRYIIVMSDKLLMKDVKKNLSLRCHRKYFLVRLTSFLWFLMKNSVGVFIYGFIWFLFLSSLYRCLFVANNPCNEPDCE